jgi:hypothetical protein
MGYDPNRENDGINRMTGNRIGTGRSIAGNHKPVILVNRSEQETLQDMLDTVRSNELIEMWVPKVRRALRSSARWFSDGKTESFVLRDHGRQTEKKLAESIGSYTQKDVGSIFKIAFKFERHGVFVHKGVGRGYKADGHGFVNRTAKHPAPGRERVAVEWFNPTLDKFLPELVDRLAKINADAVVNSTAMKIL